jgi:hypothetical protein
MIKFDRTFQDCYVKLEGNELKIGNDSIERVWNVQGDIPIVQSLKNKQTNKEWLAVSENYDWLSFPDQKYAFYNSSFTSGTMKNFFVEANTDDDCGIGRKHLRIEVNLEYEKYLIKWVHIVYPQTPILRSFIQVELISGLDSSEEVEIVTDRIGELFHSSELSDDYQDGIPLAPVHCGWKSVHFLDKTDDYDNLVHANHGLLSRRESRYVNGNLFFVEDHLAKEGITFIKEGPTPLAYLGSTKSDFYIKGQNVFTTGWGFNQKDFNKTKVISTYGSSILLWSGDSENAYTALNTYHNSLHVFVPKKDAFIMSNTWGDQSCDGRLSEGFLLKELEKAKELGINFYQIDDGWQNGTTSNSVNPGGVWGIGYYKANPDFWKINKKRFPNGLEPVIASAKEKGIRMGLWFSPDSINDFENWEKDSCVLIDLHNKYGISAFKMDGVKFETKVGEENLTKLFNRVITETNGNVFFNMDVTAEVRSGYFGRLQYGSLFVENRFTGVFGSWPNYYPHCTLRNLWMLSKYYPSNRLQMEFLNVKRNTELYKGDILSPASCGIEYSFAITMFANPLAWMELTGLDEESAHILGGIIPKYLDIQSDILSGHVLPIGDEPNGTGWAGFQSVKSEGIGYLLIIKEYNTVATHCYHLWKVKGKTLELENILGSGKQESVEVNEYGHASFELEGQFKYALYKYKTV